MQHLPRRIATVMSGTIWVLVVTFGVAIAWLVTALDREAADHSHRQVESARTNLLDHIRLLTLDYTKWDSALPAVAEPDMTWLWENVGLSAHTGEAFQLAVVWGGGLRSDVGWAVRGTEEPRSGVLDPLTLAEAEVGLRAIPINTYDGIQFFAWHQGELWVLGAARVEVGDGTLDPSVRDEAIGRFLLGHRLDEEAIAGIEGDRVIRHLAITPNPPLGRSVVPLPGADGRPVAYLAWDTPRPGSEMLGRLLAPLALVVLLTVGLSARAMRFVQASAQGPGRGRRPGLPGGAHGRPDRTAHASWPGSPGTSSSSS